MQNEEDGAATAPTHPVGAVDNAARLLLLLGETRPLRLAEAADAIGVARSTAYRLLATLQYRGLVSQDPVDKTYAPGPALLELGASVLRESDLAGLAHRSLERLCETVGETTAIAVLRGREVVYLDTVETSRPVRVGSRTGVIMPAHTSSVGKAILAALPPARVRTLFPEQKLPARTARSIVSPKALERELDRIRERGYATSFGEGEAEIGAVGAAVTDRLGRPRAAITVSAPLARMDAKRAEAVAGPLLACAAEVSARLTSSARRRQSPRL
ncbi:IclR family transcriptional regulator [Streptomyces sp. enrichment culture]|uniref:IclR family transcriptional regulator n=1 Tax=Streptomyces sp. enrichment culture TaxID=1795815 RepID=UPI003F555940